MANRLPAGVFACGNLLSKSPRMREVFDLVSVFAATDATALIVGEGGTGKQELARAIHQSSAGRRAGPLAAVCCAALPETLAESELFGHVKSGFACPKPTVRPGAFEKAQGGTVFLGHIESLPLRVQAKLLRVLQERRVVRVGGIEEVEVDVRVIASTTSLDLYEEVKKGAFREDLYFRLMVVEIRLPPLRERPEDIPLLARHFARKFSDPSRPPAELSPEAVDALLRCPWPGNVRHLENAIERACFLAGGGVILPEHLPQT